MSKMTMADLLAGQDKKSFSVTRGQEIEGTIIAILPQEIILDFGTKSEGILQKKDLTEEELSKLKVGDKLTTFVLYPENDSGQIVLGMQNMSTKSSQSSPRWKRFEDALRKNEVLTGKGLEVNKGGLIVEVGGVRGFLPTSQISLSSAAALDSLVDKDIQVTVIEADSNQNRLIFSQKVIISDELKAKLNELKVGDKVKGKVESVFPFGIFVSLDDKLEGLIHISEVSWEKVEDLASKFKVGDELEAQIVSVDTNTGRVNLSLKQLASDPFADIASKYQTDDVIKGEIIKVNAQGIFVKFDELEGVIPAAKMEKDTEYKVGESITCLIDEIDTAKRKISLAPFITSTKDLIYK